MKYQRTEIVTQTEKNTMNKSFNEIAREYGWEVVIGTAKTNEELLKRLQNEKDEHLLILRKMRKDRNCDIHEKKVIECPMKTKKIFPYGEVAVVDTKKLKEKVLSFGDNTNPWEDNANHDKCECKNLDYTNQYADSYKCRDCGKIHIKYNNNEKEKKDE